MDAGELIPIFGGGEAGRDYTYVVDIDAAVLAVLDYDLSSAPEGPFEICNLGNSQPVKLLRLGLPSFYPQHTQTKWRS
jgi:nucleoside-diphosphate-sugar epimerase